MKRLENLGAVTHTSHIYKNRCKFFELKKYGK